MLVFFIGGLLILRVTLRQKKYKANRIAGMNQHNAARAAGYSEKYSRQACRIERLVKVSIVDALERAGLTETYQANKLFKLTKATKAQVCDLYIKQDENGKYKINQNMNSFIEVEDNPIQLRALEHLAELKSQISNKPLIDQSTHITYAYIRSSKAVEERNRERTPLQAR